MAENDDKRIRYFDDSVIREVVLPERFTFPFYYEPHPLARLAAAELQHYLETKTDLNHDFGLEGKVTGESLGKMFGVLVVQDSAGRVGYLSAFSGKLAGTNSHERFVPPVFDMLAENSFFLKEQEVIDGLNDRLEEILHSERYLNSKLELETLAARAEEELTTFKAQLKANKEYRRIRRDRNAGITDEETAVTLEAGLAKESHYDRHRLRVLKADWKATIDAARARWMQYEGEADALKNERRERSAALQLQLFEQYAFLNKAGERKSLQAIFSATAFGTPPSGAGECATPKLLQYAFANGYKPVAMAEFWWGVSPPSEIRKHKHYYPACAGKCKPILAHMLQGLPMEDNPFVQSAEEHGKLETIYEDPYLLVVNKPAGLRSVPGVDISDSVYSRLKAGLADAEPLMIHRLDMGTSGLLVVAKTAEIHRKIQKQFLDRTVSKRYVALLSKAVAQDEGEINLPLIADPFNRPRQLVCFETGKKSITRWKVYARTGSSTKVHFWPLTGRTHQLRMHAAHEQGLNAPIVGDDLYGTADQRLYLHAAALSFVHPATGKRMSFEVAEPF